ncbi:hypothetical protein [Saccharopolyspora phatthalungensis]|uniref:YbaB/EbfC DNA-binding family protein n=1 Tax=Saccharopolyspora phatthalungensis TaxID=664693 RepID=A0A840PYT1_9PSEU|nr:hypothetical protein [Saccharopolyspora phatthalungensis]MBB5152927.1 hypothetical protein [Saccharopolyspora phatthalungensis]
MNYRRRGPNEWESEYDPLSEFEDFRDLDDPAPGDGPYASDTDDTPSLVGRPVAVNVTDAGVVTSVVLAAGWRRSVDPRELGAAVLSAFATATMQVLANRVEGTQQTPPVTGASTPADLPDTSPLSKEDVMRLVDAVSADLNHFTEQVSARVDQTVSVESAGGHVRGSARSGQILDVSIDPNWAASARNSEIELELTEVLKQLGELSSPGELAQGPRSRAIDELHALASDPQLFLRRVGLLS